VLVLLLAACSPESPAPDAAPPSPFHFVDVARSAGIHFVHISGSREQLLIVESMSSGAAFVDVDGDDDQDLFLVNSTRFEAPDTGGDRLYRNDGNGTFTDVTGGSGLGAERGWGMGCAAGDADGDGHVDLYVTRWGENILYQNRGDGTFERVRGHVEDPSWSTSAAFADVDVDGRLDLFVANYVTFDAAHPPQGGEACTGYKGLEVYCGPHGMEPQANRLYRNDGGGLFTDVSLAAGVDAHRHASLGVVFADLDDDGDPDLYVANDGHPNVLYRNDGDWLLEEVGAFAGAAYSEAGRIQAGMGVAAGDVDGDGHADLFVTHFSEDVNTLYRNLGGLGFVDNTAGCRLTGAVRPYLGWGTGFADFDTDGWLDLFAVNGHIYPQVDELPSGPRYGQRNLLYRNVAGVFEEVGRDSGPGWAIEAVSRGAAVADYDDDGDPDLLVMNLNGAPSLLRNVGASGNGWVGFDLRGAAGHAVGARVELWTAAGRQVREVRRGSGYLSQSDPRVLFGLGREESVERVVIRWPGGREQTLHRPQTRRYHKVRECDDRTVAYAVAPRRTPSPRAASPGERRAPVTTLPVAHQSPASAEPDLSVQPHFDEAQALFRRGRYAQSARHLQLAIQDDPSRPELYYNLGGVLYAEIGAPDQAISWLQRGIERHSSHAPLHALLGEVYLELGHADSAAVTLRWAAVLDPSPWGVHHRLGLARLRLGDLAGAEESFFEAATRAPWEPNPFLQLARLLQDRADTAGATAARAEFDRLRPVADRTQAYEKVLSEDPDSRVVRLALGRTYSQQGRRGDARRLFRELLHADSTDVEALHGLGATFHQDGDLGAAICVYERLVQLDAEHLEALADLAQAYHQSMQLDRALATYEQALRLRHLPAIHVKKGLLHAARGRWPEAASAFLVALATDSTLVGALDGLGRVRATQGRYAEAIRLWERLLRVAPEHPRAAGLIETARQELAGMP